MYQALSVVAVIFHTSTQGVYPNNSGVPDDKVFEQDEAKQGRAARLPQRDARRNPSTLLPLAWFGFPRLGRRTI